jgi:hypothetical protein
MDEEIKKEKVSVEEIAYLFLSIIYKGSEDGELIKDIDGKIILSRYERSLVILAIIYELLNKYNLKKVTDNLLYLYIKEFTEQSKLSNEIVIAALVNKIKDINRYFSTLPTQEEWIKKLLNEFPFGRNLDSSQMLNFLSWYRFQTEAIESTFKKLLENSELDK